MGPSLHRRGSAAWSASGSPRLRPAACRRGATSCWPRSTRCTPRRRDVRDTDWYADRRPLRRAGAPRPLADRRASTGRSRSPRSTAPQVGLAEVDRLERHPGRLPRLPRRARRPAAPARPQRGVARGVRPRHRARRQPGGAAPTSPAAATSCLSAEPRTTSSRRVEQRSARGGSPRRYRALVRCAPRRLSMAKSWSTPARGPSLRPGTPGGADLPRRPAGSTRGGCRQAARRHGEHLSDAQERLFVHGAGGNRSVLLVLQGMDTACSGGRPTRALLPRRAR